MENQKYVYDKICDWIKVADQKAFILATLNLVGAFYQVSAVSGLKESHLKLTVFVVFIMLSLFSFFCLFKIVYPRVDNKYKKSKMFFHHIANKYSDDVDRGIGDFMHLTDEDFKRDLCSQIVINSVVAKKKYMYTSLAIWSFGFEIILGLILARLD